MWHQGASFHRSYILHDIIVKYSKGLKAFPAFGQVYLRKEGRKRAMDRTIITVVGKDTVGIIAKVCAYLAENGINILDISQTIVQGYFNMMMIVDTNKMEKHFGQMADEMRTLGESIGVDIKCQKEEIFDKMHRI